MILPQNDSASSTKPAVATNIAPAYERELMPHLVSPDAMLKAAKEQMLDPTHQTLPNEELTSYDWVLIMNFFASNIHSLSAEPVCQLLCKIYDMPLSPRQVTEIVSFQTKRKIES
jgi:hypothetical protein